VGEVYKSLLMGGTCSGFWAELLPRPIDTAPAVDSTLFRGVLGGSSQAKCLIFGWAPEPGSSPTKQSYNS
jgi:hypothetical protein